MPNKYVNKVVIGKETKLDLTADSRAVQARRALFHPSHAGAHAGFLPYLFANRPPSSPASRPAGHHKHAPISGRPRGVRRGSGHCLRLVFAPALYRRGGVSAGFRPRTVLDKAARTRRTVHKPSCVSSTLTGSVLSCPRNRLANAPCIRQGCGSRIARQSSTALSWLVLHRSLAMW